ncbi:MAG: hypothetical protein A2096_14975 [Spirochaetes bacterium GWF1_41_5]|nr:MAG: hypothetical protein A2096_14975 [Spirochaetes bacterium GWF1_41_5]
MEKNERLKWFKEAKYGMFVHWGIYSAIKHGEQAFGRDLMPKSEYEPYAFKFKPAADWADKITVKAVDSGMKYIVLTTRHHDGYCMFDTATNNFNAVKTGPGRDLVREYVEAARKAGLKVGFYYSLLNWRWPAQWEPEKYSQQFPEMVNEIHTQLRELMTNYGKIDILWYDGSQVPGYGCHGTWEGTPIKQKTAEFYQSQKLNAMVRELQPEILINNRSGIMEDFGTPEQHITPDTEGNYWEACMTINNAPGWAYLPFSMANKTPGELLYNLVNAIRLGGNFLFNVGPNPQGYVDIREGEALSLVGAWLRKHGEAIFGTSPGLIYGKNGMPQGPMFQYGMWTCRGNTGYFIFTYYSGEELIVSKIAPGIKSAVLLTTGQKLVLEKTTNGRTIIKGLPSTPPDALAAVIKAEFEGPPKMIKKYTADWLEGNFIPEE